MSANLSWPRLSATPRPEPGTTCASPAPTSYFRTLAQARVDHTIEKAFRSFLTPDLLILDDFGLQRLTAQQSTDLYELIIARHRKSSFVMTSNRAIDEWLGLFEDAVLGNSALDRLANASYQIVIEGTSYREQSPAPKKKEALTP